MDHGIGLFTGNRGVTDCCGCTSALLPFAQSINHAVYLPPALFFWFFWFVCLFFEFLLSFFFLLIGFVHLFGF